MTINIAMSFNQKFMKYAYVMLVSLLQNKSPESAIRLFVLHNELDFEDQLVIKGLFEEYNCSVEFIWVNKEFFSPQMPITPEWSLEIYYRLLIPVLLPEDIDRVLYLDADVIVNRPLEELYTTEFEGNDLCACEDCGGLNFGEYRQRIFPDFKKEGFVYVNSGLLLMDLSRMREKDTFEEYLLCAEKFDYCLELPDMDLLNYVHRGHIKVLDKHKFQIFAMQAYNEGIRLKDAEKCFVVHYAGPKPWKGGGIHFELEKLWWDYAKKTPFHAEFTEKFTDECICDPLVYNEIHKLIEEKFLISKELEMRKELCSKLLEIVEKG